MESYCSASNSHLHAASKPCRISCTPLLKIYRGRLAASASVAEGLIDAASNADKPDSGYLQFLQGRLLKELVDTDLPVYADNDARTALIGEVLWGVARGTSKCEFRSPSELESAGQCWRME